MRIDYNGNKGFRLLNIFERFNKGEILTKSHLANEFCVSEKTIQRDIDDLRAYLSETHYMEDKTAIRYDKMLGGYRLERMEREWLTNQEVLATCKILLESRALQKNEMFPIIEKLLIQAAPGERANVRKIIQEECGCYIPLNHGKMLLDILWSLSELIAAQEIIQFVYTRQDGTQREHMVKPVAIMFSEYYFYLIAYLADDSKKYPTIFRIDRIEKLKGTHNSFSVPYSKRFNQREFRKRVQFMYSGELQTITFAYTGESLESVIDRLPTAEVIDQKDGAAIIRVQSYGAGIDMWLNSQGDRIKILSRKQ